MTPFMPSERTVDLLNNHDLFSGWESLFFYFYFSALRLRLYHDNVHKYITYINLLCERFAESSDYTFLFYIFFFFFAIHRFEVVIIIVFFFHNTTVSSNTDIITYTHAHTVHVVLIPFAVYLLIFLCAFALIDAAVETACKYVRTRCVANNEYSRS